MYGSSCRLLTGYEDRVAKKRSLYLLWAFLIPFVLLFCIYLSRAIYPFGNGSVLILDLNGQYVYFFAELRNKLLHGGIRRTLLKFQAGGGTVALPKD